MWCPALAAIATRLVFQHDLRGFGWRRGKPRYLLLSSSDGVALNSGVTLVPISFAVTATVLVVIGALTALGEELGWRGFLVPELARSTSFHRVALVSGGIWAAWLRLSSGSVWPRTQRVPLAPLLWLSTVSAATSPASPLSIRPAPSQSKPIPDQVRA